jgi:branched-chain amino acid transport system ATP-binding protein
MNDVPLLQVSGLSRRYGGLRALEDVTVRASARGLMGKPDIMMIDELSLGLAPVIVDEIMSRLPDIAASGTSVLLVEQDVGIALETAEHAHVLETGRVTLAGPPAGLLLADTRIQQAYLGQI